MENKMTKVRKTKNKEKTLRGMFLEYIAAFCVNTLLVCGIVVAVLIIMTESGKVLPANYSEQWFNEHEDAIRTLEDISTLDFPRGSEYGMYAEDGEWISGTIPEDKRAKTWDGYEKQDMSALDGFYRFFERENGEICIIKYYFRMQYTSETLDKILPAPELALPILAVILFLVQVIFLAGHFSKSLKKRLVHLENVTRKISENNLEFTVQKSDIKEINEVLTSVGHMKDALQQSLKKQWDMEAEQNRQVRALVHDIKTPLTIIRGNAELTAEENTDGLTAAYQKTILKSTDEIESYLDKMRLILLHQNAPAKEICIPCSKFQEQLKAQAEQLCLAKDLPLMVQCRETEGVIQVNQEQLKRAWDNIISNAMEYTDAEQGIDVQISTAEKDGKSYLCAGVLDYGQGFSPKELQHATEELYRGDASRHDRSHQGLGLAIAKRFVEAQGGFLEIGNSSKTGGGEVVLWLVKK
mgnify:CR=1 FL=1